MIKKETEITLEDHQGCDGDEDFSTVLINMLTVPIYPVKIEGRVEDYNGLMTITMSNGDAIQWIYCLDPSDNSKDDFNNVIINGVAHSILGSVNPPQDDMQRLYTESLQKKG